MNKLIWKELREMRLIPIATALIVVVTLLVCHAASNWMASHGLRGLDQMIGPSDCLPFLILGLAGAGIFVGSVAIAPETGSGTLAFLSALPIGRPRVWTAKVIAGVVVMLASAVTVTVGWAITVRCLFPGLQLNQALSGIQDPIIANALTGTVVDWIAVSTFHAALAAFAVTASAYCVALLVSTLVDRTSTAGVVAVIATLLAGGGLFYFWNRLDQSHRFTVSGLVGYGFDEHDPHSLQAGIVAYVLVMMGLLSTSFIAFCQGDSLRSRRPLVITVVALLGWFTTAALGFAAYGRHLQEGWQSIAMRRSQAWSANVAESRTVGTTIAAPSVHGQHWTIFIDHALIGENGFCLSPVVIGVGNDDLDTPGAIPVKTRSSHGVEARIVTPRYGPVGLSEYYRASSKVTIVRSGGWGYFQPATVTVQPDTLGNMTAARRIVPGPTVAKVIIYYWSKSPLDRDRQTVRLYDKRGRMVGAIDVVVRSKAVFVDHCKSVPGGICY